MDRSTGPRAISRGVVLVATRSASFADIVGGMVSDSGYAPVYWAESEPARLPVTRTEPCIVICDCDGPKDDVQRLVTEASARGVPVLLSRSQAGNEFEPILGVGQRVAWFTFPSTREAFKASLDGLMPRMTQRVRHMRATVLGVKVDAAFSVLTLSTASPAEAVAGRVSDDPSGESDGVVDRSAGDDGTRTLRLVGRDTLPSARE